MNYLVIALITVFSFALTNYIINKNYAKEDQNIWHLISCTFAATSFLSAIFLFKLEIGVAIISITLSFILLYLTQVNDRIPIFNGFDAVNVTAKVVQILLIPFTFMFLLGIFRFYHVAIQIVVSLGLTGLLVFLNIMITEYIKKKKKGKFTPRYIVPIYVVILSVTVVSMLATNTRLGIFIQRITNTDQTQSISHISDFGLKNNHYTYSPVITLEESGVLHTGRVVFEDNHYYVEKLRLNEESDFFKFDATTGKLVEDDSTIDFNNYNSVAINYRELSRADITYIQFDIQDSTIFYEDYHTLIHNETDELQSYFKLPFNDGLFRSNYVSFFEVNEDIYFSINSPFNTKLEIYKLEKKNVMLDLPFYTLYDSYYLLLIMAVFIYPLKTNIYKVELFEENPMFRQKEKEE